MSASFVMPGAAEMRATLRLALPVVVARVGFMMMGVVDTVMVGHLSSADLAATALGHLFVFGLSGFGMGVMMVVDPLVSQALGAGDVLTASRAVRRGLVLAVLMSVPTALVLLPGELALSLLEQPEEIRPLAAAYARVCIPSLPAFFVFIVLRQVLQAMERVRSIVLATFIANVVNAVTDWVLVFGIAGAPRLGVVGCAWATTLSRWTMLVLVVALAWRDLGPVIRRARGEGLAVLPVLRMVRLGAPIGVQLQLEFAAFAAIAVLMGWLGTVEMAAHQVALNLASVTFMVPLGVSMAAAVRVGRAVGRDDLHGMRQAATASLLAGGLFMACCGALFLALPATLAALYTTVSEVRGLAARLIPIAGVFQVFDGIQVVAAGALRGLGDTRSPMVINLVGFWVLGMPVGLVLTFRMDLGAPGLWWGVVAGLGSVAVFLVARLRQRLQARVERLHVE
jgi:MATE family multidrug resistance protein